MPTSVGTSLMSHAVLTRLVNYTSQIEARTVVRVGEDEDGGFRTVRSLVGFPVRMR